MADDRKKRGREDGRRINVHQRHELRYWTKRLGVNVEELRTAVSWVGPVVKRVAEALGKKRDPNR